MEIYMIDKWSSHQHKHLITQLECFVIERRWRRGTIFHKSWNKSRFDVTKMGNLLLLFLNHWKEWLIGWLIFLLPISTDMSDEYTWCRWLDMETETGSHDDDQDGILESNCKTVSFIIHPRSISRFVEMIGSMVIIIIIIMIIITIYLYRKQYQYRMMHSDSQHYSLTGFIDECRDDHTQY